MSDNAQFWSAYAFGWVCLLFFQAPWWMAILDAVVMYGVLRHYSNEMLRRDR